MTGFEYILIPLIAFLAYLLKAMTGFGPAIVLISFGSLFLPAYSIVATSAILDIIAGIVLLKVDWKDGSYRYWLPLAVAIVIGTVAGAFLIKIVSPEGFHFILSIAIIVIGLWFIFGRTNVEEGKLRCDLPKRCTRGDTGFTFLGGFCGGMFGISGPPIIWNFGRQFTKRAFRQVLVPVFVVAAVARSGMYSLLGIVDLQVMKYVAFAVPGLFLGIFIGNRIFFKISEILFGRIVGAILIIIGVKHFF